MMRATGEVSMRLWFFILVLGIASSLEAERLVLSIAADPTTPEMTLYLKGETQALKSLGFDVSYQYFPGERSLAEADVGRTDGDAARIDLAEVGTRFPRLIKVPEPMGWLTARAYTVGDLAITSLKDLVRPGRRIGAFSGMVWSMTVLKPMIEPENWNQVPEYEQAFRMLVAGRVDVVVAVPIAVEQLLTKPIFATVKAGPILGREPNYLYLNRRWADHIPAISEAFRRLIKP